MKSSKYQLEALERDGYKCVDCGSTEKLIVHHSDNSRITKKINNKLSNLVTLCKSCHAKRHGLDMDDRNFQVYQDYESGNYIMVDLVVKYQITSARIYQIIKRIEKRLT